MLALDERGGLAHVLLFRGALGGEEERLSVKLLALLLSISFISPQKGGGDWKNLDEPNFRVTLDHASLWLGALELKGV